MPLLILALLALLGVGFYTRESAPVAVTVTVEPATMAPDHAAWSRECQARLTEAAREFEAAAYPEAGCFPGAVTITTLPSGVDYVEYTLQSGDGAVYRAVITEEPDDEIVGPGWRNAPRPREYNHFDVVRHDHGRLGAVSGHGPRGFLFAQHMEPAANFCIEQAQ